MKSTLSDIHPNAQIGENVTIDSFVKIEEDVIIGEGTWIGSNVTIMNGARIGKNCRIFPGAVISAIPQDLKFKGENTTAEIGDNTTVRECVTVNRGTAAKDKTVVGSNCLLMAYVHVAHDAIIGNNVIIANSVQIAGEVEIDDCAVIGGTSAFHQFVRVGKYAMVSGGSLVMKDVPPFSKAARNPLSYVGINSVGLKRRGFSTEKIDEIQSVYRVLFQSGLNNKLAVEEIEKTFASSEERDEILNFIKSSDRGLMKGYRQE